MTVFDTIAAVSTPRGKGGVALLRISGPEALSICEKIFKPKNGREFVSYAKEHPRKELYGTIYTYENNQLVATDDGLAVFFPNPHSFTGEDVVELCCHGGILLTETILSALFVAGARPATAGEFTKRAFINGKIGLSSAEALGKLLEAKTTNQLALAHTALTGKTEQACNEIYNAIARVLSSVYAKIDYPDEDLADMSREEMITSLSECLALAQKLASTYKTGHAIAEGIPTAICGRPNVGKSTLYNALVGRDAAIVTDVAGTTRDILSETVAFGKLTLQLFDTAGIHETADKVEKIGVQRAEKVLHDAELIFAVFDGSMAPESEDLELLEALKTCDAPIFYLLNKSDNGIVKDYEKLLKNPILLSAKEGKGLEVLKEKVEEIFLEGNINIREDAVLLNARQDASVNACMNSLMCSIDTLKKGYPFDLCCTDAEQAMQSIAEVDGRAVSEDIVAQIFSHFCVGK